MLSYLYALKIGENILFTYKTSALHLFPTSPPSFLTNYLPINLNFNTK